MCVWIISRLTANPTLTILVRPVFQCSTTFEMEIESWHSFWNIWRLLLKYVPYILAKYDDTLWKSNQVNLFQICYTSLFVTLVFFWLLLRFWDVTHLELPIVEEPVVGSLQDWAVLRDEPPGQEPHSQGRLPTTSWTHQGNPQPLQSQTFRNHFTVWRDLQNPFLSGLSCVITVSEWGLYCSASWTCWHWGRCERGELNIYHYKPHEELWLNKHKLQTSFIG